MCTKSWLGQGFSTQSSPTSHLLASERLEDRIAQMGVFGYVCYCHRRLTDIPAKWRAAFAGRRTPPWDSTAPTSRSRPFFGRLSRLGIGGG
jgi:hypothetical protein